MKARRGRCAVIVCVLVRWTAACYDAADISPQCLGPAPRPHWTGVTGPIGRLVAMVACLAGGSNGALVAQLAAHLLNVDLSLRLSAVLMANLGLAKTPDELTSRESYCCTAVALVVGLHPAATAPLVGTACKHGLPVLLATGLVLFALAKRLESHTQVEYAEFVSGSADIGRMPAKRAKMLHKYWQGEAVQNSFMCLGAYVAAGACSGHALAAVYLLYLLQRWRDIIQYAGSASDDDKDGTDSVGACPWLLSVWKALCCDGHFLQPVCWCTGAMLLAAEVKAIALSNAPAGGVEGGLADTLSLAAWRGMLAGPATLVSVVYPPAAPALFDFVTALPLWLQQLIQVLKQLEKRWAHVLPTAATAAGGTGVLAVAAGAGLMHVGLSFVWWVAGPKYSTRLGSSVMRWLFLCGWFALVCPTVAIASLARCEHGPVSISSAGSVGEAAQQTQAVGRGCAPNVQWALSSVSYMAVMIIAGPAATMWLYGKTATLQWRLHHAMAAVDSVFASAVMKDRGKHAFVSHSHILTLMHALSACLCWTYLLVASIFVLYLCGKCEDRLVMQCNTT